VAHLSHVYMPDHRGSLVAAELFGLRCERLPVQMCGILIIIVVMRGAQMHTRSYRQLCL
jgi:hypothetical protein